MTIHLLLLFLIRRRRGWRRRRDRGGLEGYDGHWRQQEGCGHCRGWQRHSAANEGVTSAGPSGGHRGGRLVVTDNVEEGAKTVSTTTLEAMGNTVYVCGRDHAYKSAQTANSHGTWTK
jgi:hypothetical protein